MPETKLKRDSNPSQELILLLQEIERRSGVERTNLPRQDEARALWDGILFTIVGTSVVALLSDVKEILNLPSSLTRIPGTRSWMLGIANIRGNLLPIVDLQVFLGGKPITKGKRSRVLVIEHNGLRVGLLVGGVQGIGHFEQDQRVPVPPIAGKLVEFTNQAFQLGEQVWPVFEINALSQSPEFQMAAI